MTVTGLALLIAGSAALVSGGRGRAPVVLAASVVAGVVLAAAHGPWPAVALACATVTAAVSFLVVARPLVPRIVSRVPGACAIAALLALAVEVLGA